MIGGDSRKICGSTIVLNSVSGKSSLPSSQFAAIQHVSTKLLINIVLIFNNLVKADSVVLTFLRRLI